MSGSTIRSCTCTHAYQDKIHGKGNRVHNIGSPAKGTPDQVCTVCGTPKKK